MHCADYCSTAGDSFWHWSAHCFRALSAIKDQEIRATAITIMKVQAFLLIIFIACYNCEESDKIFGGSYASRYQFPHQVSIFQRTFHWCAGSILDNLHILTAARCVKMWVIESRDKHFQITNRRNYRKHLSILAGTNILSSGGVRVGIEKIFIHENYTGKYEQKQNNIAVIRLKTPLVYSRSIKPIELYPEDLLISSRVIYSGWGTESHWEINIDFLKYNGGTTISSSECARKSGVSSEGQFCLSKFTGNGFCSVSLGSLKLCASDNDFFLRVTLEVARSTLESWLESPVLSSADVELQIPMCSRMFFSILIG